MSSRPSPSLSVGGLALLLGLLSTLVLATIALPGPKPQSGAVEVSLPLRAPAADAAGVAADAGVCSLARASLPTVNFLQVEVCDATGRAVPQAAVTYYQESVIGFPAVALGSTGVTGSFQSAALPPGCYRVRAAAPGWQDSAVLEVQIPALADERIQFALDPPPATR